MIPKSSEVSKKRKMRRKDDLTSNLKRGKIIAKPQSKIEASVFY